MDSKLHTAVAVTKKTATMQKRPTNATKMGSFCKHFEHLIPRGRNK